METVEGRAADRVGGGGGSSQQRSGEGQVDGGGRKRTEKEGIAANIRSLLGDRGEGGGRTAAPVPRRVTYQERGRVGPDDRMPPATAQFGE